MVKELQKKEVKNKEKKNLQTFFASDTVFFLSFDFLSFFLSAGFAFFPPLKMNTNTL